MLRAVMRWITAKPVGQQEEEQSTPEKIQMWYKILETAETYEEWHSAVQTRPPCALLWAWAACGTCHNIKQL